MKETKEMLKIVLGTLWSQVLGLLFFAIGAAILLPIFFFLEGLDIPPEKQDYVFISAGIILAIIFIPLSLRIVRKIEDRGR